jgi:hypothetical protein
MNARGKKRSAGRARRPGRIERAMNIYGEWDWRILAVLIIGGLIAGWMLG